MSDPTGPNEPAVVGTRWPEVVVAGCLLLVSIGVVSDSLRVGIGWADDGPRAGYFPFYIGLLLMASSGWILLRQLMSWKAADPVFAERSQLALVIAVLVPIAIYIVGISLMGIYLASLVLIAYFMRRYGKYGWGPTAAVSIGVPLFFFFVFERWFLVLLPKGPIEALFGL